MSKPGSGRLPGAPRRGSRQLAEAVKALAKRGSRASNRLDSSVSLTSQPNRLPANLHSMTVTENGPRRVRTTILAGVLSDLVERRGVVAEAAVT